MKKTNTAKSAAEKRSVVDIKRIVDALEGAGCEVLEVGLYRDPADPTKYSGNYFAHFRPCSKPLVLRRL